MNELPIFSRIFLKRLCNIWLHNSSLGYFSSGICKWVYFSKKYVKLVFCNLCSDMLEAIKAEQRSSKNTDWFSPNVDYWLINVCLEVGVFEYFSCENELTCWSNWIVFCTTTTLLQYWQKNELLFKVLKTSPYLLRRVCFRPKSYPSLFGQFTFRSNV
jgi:hypothetical protein